MCSQSASDPFPGGPVHLGRGPRHTEAALLARLRQLLAPASTRPELLARPVLVVVPSASLRDHLGALLVRSEPAGPRAVAGLAVRTLFAAAQEVLARAGERAPRGGRVLLEVLVRRFGASQPALEELGRAYADGLAAAVAAVRDLLDAGFTDDHLPAVDEQLAALPALGVAHRRQVERGRALLRLAAAAARACRELGLGLPGDTYSRAAALLREDPELLAAREVLIHGYADATGVVLDLLEVLRSRRQAELFVDLPPDPAAPGRSAGSAFVERLVGRLAGATAGELMARGPSPLPAQPPSPAAPSLTLLAAPGAYSEAREAVRRVRDLLDSGCRPESIALTARDLTPYRLPLSQAFSRLAVPFSAPGTPGSPGVAERRLAALGELLRQGLQVPVDVWLSAHGQAAFAGSSSRISLRLALRTLGALSLSDVAGVDPEAVLSDGALPLPVRQGGGEAAPGEGEGDGLEDGGEDGDDAREGGEAPGSPGLARRRLPGALLRAAVSGAQGLVRHLQAWPGGGGSARASLGEQADHLRALVQKHLGWAEESGDGLPARLEEALEALCRELSADFPLSAEELAPLLGRQLDEAARLPWGGRGGGVQVLSVTEARARTFEHLFLLGVNRHLFPRRVEDDPLLPDAVRRALAAVLPDVPVKARGHDEERYLFAQLLAAAPAVTLSWLHTDDDGDPASPSPLLERLRLARPELAVAEAPHLHSLPRSEIPPLSPPAELLTLSALQGGREAFLAALPAVLEAGGVRDPQGLARFRGAALAELEPDRSTPAGRAAAGRLGPYLGLVGPLREGGQGSAWVTQLEALARCSWQALLIRGLGLEPAPDPLGAFVRLDGLLVGSLVHAFFERLVTAAGGRGRGELGQVLSAGPVAVPWPDREGRRRLLLAAAAQVARREGVPLLARPLAARAETFLEAVAGTDLGRGWQALGAEVTGEVPVPGLPDPLRFRADLVQLAADGEVLFTDLKTGKPLSEAKGEETRSRHLLAGVRQGERLQAVAYALAGAGAGAAAAGRYLFLGRPEREVPERSFPVRAEETGCREAFAAAVDTLQRAREEGAFTPRLLDADLEKEGPACRSCDVREACLQGDSGATRRLARWVEAGRAGREEAALAAAALAVFRLRDPQPAGGGES